MTPGSIVQCRNREWVLLPGDQENLLLLRPLTGATDEVVAIHKGLSDLLGYSFPEERVRSAKFPPPTPDDLSNATGSHLLWQAARLTLREGATPLRSLGRISIRPRAYQFVPLLMALHELCHLIEHNHTERFWSLVARADRDFERKERWMKENGGRFNL